MIETGLRTLLAAQPSIAAIVGQRIYVGEAQQKDTLPYVTIDKLTADFLNTLDAQSEDDLTFKDFDITGWGKTEDSARRAAHAVRTFLKDYRGYAGVEDRIEAVLVTDESDGYLPPTDASAVGRYFTSLDVQIQHKPGG